MKLEDINAFVAVVRYESITGAAEALLTRQPLISRRVQSLEKDLGVTLVDRQTKPTRPTALGLRVFEKCEAVLRDLALIEELVQGDTTPTGTLRVGVAEIIAELALLDAMPKMLDEAPIPSIEIASGWSTDMIAKLKHGEVDAAIVVLPATTRFDEGLTATMIGELPMVVVAQKGSVPSRTCHLADLHGMDWVLNPEGCGFRDGLFRAFSDRGLSLQVSISTFGTEQKLGLVAHGVGLGFVPENMFESSAYVQDLQRVVLDDFAPRPCVWRVHPVNLGRVTAQVERFGGAIMTALEQRSTPGTRRAPVRRSRTRLTRAEAR